MSYLVYRLEVGGQTRYVGSTSHTLRSRLSNHLSAARLGSGTPVATWIRSLRAPPSIVEIDRASDLAAVLRLEGEWIARLNKSGCRLLNVRLLPTPHHGSHLSDVLTVKLTLQQESAIKDAAKTSRNTSVWARAVLLHATRRIIKNKKARS